MDDANHEYILEKLFTLTTVITGHMRCYAVKQLFYRPPTRSRVRLDIIRPAFYTILADLYRKIKKLKNNNQKPTVRRFEYDKYPKFRHFFHARTLFINLTFAIND